MTTPSSAAGHRASTKPRLPFAVGELSIEDGEELAMWRTPGPWTVNDALEPPESDEGYWAVRDADGDLVGYCCFGESARVPGLTANPAMLDVALGLRPDLVGRGLSPALAQTVVDHARQVAAGRRLRSVVAEWNDAGRKAAEKAGFRVTGAHDIPGGATVSSYLVYAMS